MRVHAIVDYSFLYYKYKFQLEAGRMKRLTQAMDWHGVTIEKDISQIYYSLREIESFRRNLEAQGYDVTASICFDMPSKRKESDTSEAEKYKSNRTHKLGEDDFENICFVKELLDRAGYNTYKIDGFEADDLIAKLVDSYKDSFDYTIIYTPDADMLVHVCGTVGAQRYKSGKGYTFVTHDNFSEYLSEEMKCGMPFNGLMLFKCTVGDKSDCIDGIKKFGPKAFDKLVEHLNSLGINWQNAGSYGSVYVILNALNDYLTDEQLKQAFESLELVRPADIDIGEVPLPTKQSNRQLREASYGAYNMKSLID